MVSENWDIIGHNWAVKSLQQHISKKTQKQAYLITGPESVGKTTLAIRYAQAMNCLQATGDGNPCMECSDCQKIEKMVHPDLTIVQPEEPRGSLKVDQIRELQYGLHLAPYEAKYRIALILNFEQATDNAANALLTTLEEPLENVVILIIAENVESLLPTIVSRCESIRLNPVPSGTLTDQIQTIYGITSDEARFLTQISGGRPGYCIRLHLNPQLLEQRAEWLDTLNTLLVSNRVERFAYVDEWTKKGENVYPQLETWLGFWRDVLLMNRNENFKITNIDYSESIKRLAKTLDNKKIIQIVIRFEETFRHLDHHVNSRLAIEDLMLILPFNPN